MASLKKYFQWLFSHSPHCWSVFSHLHQRFWASIPSAQRGRESTGPELQNVTNLADTKSREGGLLKDHVFTIFWHSFLRVSLGMMKIIRGSSPGELKFITCMAFGLKKFLWCAQLIDEIIKKHKSVQPTEEEKKRRRRRSHIKKIHQLES